MVSGLICNECLNVNLVVQALPLITVCWLSVFVSLKCFAVRSLGWVEISEEEMAPGKSSIAVNNCIRQLSYHKHNLHDTAGIWGEVCMCLFYAGDPEMHME